MNSRKKFFNAVLRHIPLIFAGFILFMDLIAILAPILAQAGMTEAAGWIYSSYRLLCHHRSWRSLHIFDYQFAWCTRDTFIYITMGLSAIAVDIFKVRKFKWYWVVLAVLPFAFDGILQMIAEIVGRLDGETTYFYASTNLIRMLTGSFFETAAGLGFFSVLGAQICG